MRNAISRATRDADRRPNRGAASALHGADLPAGHPSGPVDGHRRAGFARTGTFDVHDTSNSDAFARRTPAVDVVEDLTHRSPVCRASWSKRNSGSSARRGTGTVDDASEALQSVDRMALDEVVHVGKCRCHAPRQWRVSRGDLERIDPHESVADPLESSHLLGEKVGLTSIPSVAQDDDGGAPSHAPHSPEIVELAQAFAEPCAAAPILHSD